MPQMAPMDWLILFLYFFFIYYLVLIIIYFMIKINLMEAGGKKVKVNKYNFFW